MQTSNQNTWQKIWQADKDHFIHPWTEFESFKKEGSIIFQSAKGSYIFASNSCISWSQKSPSERLSGFL